MGKRGPLTPDDPSEIGPYELVKRLGSGGMGTVYLAKGADGSKVALKAIRRDFAADPVYRARFHEEVSNARKVASFCTARVLDHGEHDGLLYLVTEYIDGVSLEDHLIEHGALEPSVLHAAAVGVAAALTAIHAVGLVHRDLKPANVMLTLAGPRVIDFGLARSTHVNSRHTNAGMVMGTPGWIAPEQVFEGRTSPAGDVFAWGSLIAYAGLGGHPFGEGDAYVMAARARTAPPDLRGLPAPLDRLVAAAIHPDPARRPASRQLLLELVGAADEPAAQLAATRHLTSMWDPAVAQNPPGRPAPFTPPPAHPGTPAQPPHPGSAGQPPHPGTAGQPPHPGTAGQPPHPGTSGQPARPGPPPQPGPPIPGAPGRPAPGSGGPGPASGGPGHGVPSPGRHGSEAPGPGVPGSGGPGRQGPGHSTTGQGPLPGPAGPGPVRPGSRPAPHDPRPGRDPRTGPPRRSGPGVTGPVPLAQHSTTGQGPLPRPSATGQGPLPHPSTTGQGPLPPRGFGVPQRSARRGVSGCLIAAVIVLVVIVLFIALMAWFFRGPSAAGEGASVQDGKLKFTVTATKCPKPAKTAERRQCRLSVRVSNIGQEARVLYPGQQKLIDQDDVLHGAARLLDKAGKEITPIRIDPGQSFTGALEFDLPKTASAEGAELHDSGLSRGVRVELG
ncbi:protein kinase domain-containing protein [Nonomuraea endophytica]|uniref:Serine/threonine protein kinase n=1 Tax=Nonomuraea endophytica TaxID=714136 RepID=A0A7W8A4V6_9ACTN|nr:protein kinase [Nonomuraea endophytica]MBB5078905.1 serine/threonine protein kinase [Nonomuraea endophytica]